MRILTEKKEKRDFILLIEKIRNLKKIKKIEKIFNINKKIHNYKGKNIDIIHE